MKSLSPFIASILLIVLTVSVVIIFYSWSSGLLKIQSSQTQTLSQRVMSCTGASFEVFWNNECNLDKRLILWLRMDEGSGKLYL